MRFVSTLEFREIAGWIAISRLMLGSKANLQAPPNLAPEVLELLLRAGVSDWGGVSPVTVDFINPEAPWPGLKDLQDRTEQAGQELVFRLPVYPDHIDRPEFFETAMLERIKAFAGSDGYAKKEGSEQETA